MEGDALDVNMRKIKLTRNKGWFGRFRALKLYIDSTEVGSINSGETLSLDIPNGAQELYGKMDWGKTNKYSLAFIEDGDALFANGRFTFNLLRNLAIIEIPIQIQTEAR